MFFNVNLVLYIVTYIIVVVVVVVVVVVCCCCCCCYYYFNKLPWCSGDRRLGTPLAVRHLYLA